MSFPEKTGRADELRHWYGDVEADYIYTSGVAGDRFFKELRDTGKLLGTWCPTCEAVCLPPRLYCEECLTKMSDWRDVGDRGTVEAFTVARVDDQGDPLHKPVLWGLVRFDGAKGGFVHRLLAAPEAVEVGMAVRVVLKEKGERAGSITDILGFEPA